MHSEVCLYKQRNDKYFWSKSGITTRGVSLLQIFFLIYGDEIVKKSESSSGIKIGDCTVPHLLYLDDLVLLDFTQNGLQAVQPATDNKI